MEFSIKLHTIRSGWSSLKIDFVLTNSVDPDKMLQYAAFRLDLHCLSKYRLAVSGPQRNIILAQLSSGVICGAICLLFSLDFQIFPHFV